MVRPYSIKILLPVNKKSRPFRSAHALYLLYNTFYCKVLYTVFTG
nr:MAG TPA: hypothetical protein [Caudoviricetes sp.]DAQ41982.1 MAG TPA: hypothetical protein [Caudoviricetes sp.]DAW45637.1 MAG TPA: hypothetical protein [Caudoviricetes sp.]